VNERFETAVELAASIGTHLIDQGYVLGIAESAPVQLTGRPGIGRAGLAGLPVSAYDPPGGGHALLTGLAALQQLPRAGTDPVNVLGAALRRNPQSVPVFLVIVDGDVDELAGLVGVRALCDPLVAFFVGGRPELRERFERFGITCVDVASGEAPESAWRRAGIQSRVVRRG
jgi:uncharacterized protein (DUF58 family)